MTTRPAPLFIVSGPSGTGKSTLIRDLLAAPPVPLRLSVSATTRGRRPQEREGVDYHFWTRDRFEQARDAGAFLEWAEVYGNYYGTPSAEVEPHRAQGVGVILDIDTQGAAQVRRLCPDAVGVFVRTSSLIEYERRLRARGTESAADVLRRVAGAKNELAHADEYHYQVINDDLGTALAQLRDIAVRETERSRRDAG